MAPGLLFAETNSISPLKSLNPILKNGRKQDLNFLYQVCIFQADWNTKIAAQAFDLLKQLWLLLWNCWMELNKPWQEARSLRPLPI